MLLVLLGVALACSAEEPDSIRSAAVLRGAPVVLIVVDTLRADHLEPWGYERATSPHLANWSESGRVYERALATSPWTLPSVASILTGALPSRHRAGNVPLVDGRKPGLIHDPSLLTPLASDVTTLAESFRAQGYATGAVVTNSFLADEFGVRRGFDHYDYVPAFAKQSRRAGSSVDSALAWVEEQGDGPFFLMLHLFDPHLGYDAPPPVRGRFTNEFQGGRYTLPFIGEKGLGFGLIPLEERDEQFVRAAYDEEIAWVDSQIERLRQGLARAGLLDAALVILTSDHGEELFDHGSFEHGHSMFLEVLHVPLIVWGPGIVAGREHTWVSIADVAPTVREALGLPVQPDTAGRSLWSNLSQGQALENVPVYAEFNVYGPRQRTMLHWPDKLTHIVEHDVTLLYDLSADPAERESLAETLPEKAGALLARLDAVLAEAERASGEHGAATRADGRSIDPETEESLRSLGYIASEAPGGASGDAGGDAPELAPPPSGTDVAPP
jgi:choline-sulfatase